MTRDEYRQRVLGLFNADDLFDAAVCRAVVIGFLRGSVAVLPPDEFVAAALGALAALAEREAENGMPPVEDLAVEDGPVVTAQQRTEHCTADGACRRAV